MQSRDESKRSLAGKLFAAVTVLALALVCFSFGAAVVLYEIPPYKLVHRVDVKARSTWWWYDLQGPLQLDDHPHVSRTVAPAGRTLGRHDPERAQPGVTLAEAFAGDLFALLLLDMDGRQLHRWDIPDEIYDTLQDHIWSIDRGAYYIMGAHLYENGDVLLIVSYEGLLKLDRCSNLLWFLRAPIHHDVTVEPDGTIWTLSAKYVTGGDEALPRIVPPYMEDTILRVTPDGKAAEEFSVLRAIFDAGREGLVLEGPQDTPKSGYGDPTHANNIEIVGAAFAARHPFAEPGDFLLSLRSVDSLLLIDRRRRIAKWSLSDMFLRQHDSDMLPDGSISVYDNRTDKGQFNEAVRLAEPQAFGYSRILRFDPATQEILWQYRGTREDPFYSSIQGEHQYLANGNVLIAEPEAGRVFEVDPDTGETVWEWFNLLERRDGADLVGRVTRATRYGDAYRGFLDRDCPP